MKSLTPNKTRSQAQVALNSGFFWTNNQPIEFEKHTIKNGIPFIEKHKGIILLPIDESLLSKKFTDGWKAVYNKVIGNKKIRKYKTLSEMNIESETGL